MKSKTKHYVDIAKIKQIFAQANLGEVTSIESLDAGEFNTAYFVMANSKEYVIKIAPNSKEHLLTYENDLMAKEVAFYHLIEAKTSVKTPHIYCYDNSKTIIASDYFIMEKLNSKPMTACKLTKQERKNAYLKVGEAVAELHKIKGEKFGYEQNKLYDNWYLAISSMVDNLNEDCKRYGKKSPGYKLLEYIAKYKDILLKVKPVYTHFDIWDGNIFYQKKDNDIEIAIIDTERGFWGDSIGDFVSLEMATKLIAKNSIISYNKLAENPISFTKEEIIRFNIMLAYLALIIHTEKYARYKSTQLKYLINILLSKYFLKKSFAVLKKY